MKILIAYYSRTGHTEQVAKEIAARCQADVDRIRDDGVDRSGVGGYLRRERELEPPKHAQPLKRFLTHLAA